MKKLLALFLSFPLWASLVASDDDSVNNGENILTPVTRFDVRLAYETGVDAVQGNTPILTLRTDRVTDLPNDWQLSLRVDVPYWWFSCPASRLQAGCKPFSHLADVLAQVILIMPPFREWNFGYGLKVTFPTDGGNVEIGDAKYVFYPTVGIAYDLSQWSPGAYWGVTVRHAASAGGYASAPTIKRTYIQPTLNMNLSRDWFINMSPEICYNWELHGWFVPFDLMLGWMVTPKLVASIEYEYGLVQSYHEFSQKVEGRLGFFF